MKRPNFDPFSKAFTDAVTDTEFIHYLSRDRYIIHDNGIWLFREDRISVIPLVQGILSGDRTAEEFAETLDKDMALINRLVDTFVQQYRVHSGDREQVRCPKCMTISKVIYADDTVHDETHAYVVCRMCRKATFKEFLDVEIKAESVGKGYLILDRECDVDPQVEIEHYEDYEGI